MYWNTDCEPGHMAQHHSVDLTNALAAKLEEITAARFQSLAESRVRRPKAVSAAYEYLEPFNNDTHIKHNMGG